MAKRRAPSLRIIMRWILQCCIYNNRIPMFGKIRIEWDKRMTSTAGIADTYLNVIKLSPKEWKRFSLYERKQLIFHETCHLLCPEREGHGKLWKQKMAKCGYPNASMYIR